MTAIGELIRRIQETTGFENDEGAAKAVLENVAAITDILATVRKDENLLDIDSHSQFPLARLKDLIYKRLKPYWLSAWWIESNRSHPGRGHSQKERTSYRLDGVLYLIAKAVRDFLINEGASVLVGERTTQAKAEEPHKGLKLDQSGLTVDGKHYPLKPNERKMWKTLFDLNGEAALKDFVGIAPQKVKKNMPNPVRRLINSGIPHRGYVVARLQKITK